MLGVSFIILARENTKGATTPVTCTEIGASENDLRMNRTKASGSSGSSLWVTAPPCHRGLYISQAADPLNFQPSLLERDPRPRLACF